MAGRNAIRKGVPKEKRTLKGTVKERAAIMAEVTKHLPAVTKAERMGPAVSDEAMAFIGCGGSLNEFCKRAGLPYSTVAQWILKNDRERYQAARAAGAEALADRVLEIATTPVETEERTETIDPDGRVTTTVRTADNVAARKLAVWGVLELMKSWSPDRYGKRVTVEAGGRMAEAIAAARSRVGEDKGRRLGKPAAAEVIDVEPVETTGDLF